ncbi:hypothetical protein [Ferruginibacter sp. HRS2-29]|uniref:hypothetical protein n=1 Tax=Ferruginibacter sp. HRS2-29 TaxID=2487334 RepID=UPI0020CE1454|nr:hypothetical protein [Ferruginibacter sp. HRS2-29]MCP9750210.1 hypothetical protein [Ferruginibacter sp. HRS2-29]
MRSASLFIFCFLFSVAAKAQSTAGENEFHQKDFTITYDINIISNKKKTIAETYNGAVKSVYVKGNSVKLRLVSLMRIQNIYYTHLTKDTSAVAVIVKESGKSKYKFKLGKSNWELFNAKYVSAEIKLSEDSLLLLNRVCKKAVLTYPNGSKLTAYYVPGTKNEALAAAEPMFAGLPGIVLQYEYHQGKKGILYTASNISFEPLAASYFTIPSKGYPTKKFTPGKTFKGNIPEDEEEEED